MTTRVTVVDEDGKATPGNSTTVAYAASRVGRSSPGTRPGLSGYNSRTGAQFTKIHEGVSIPADSAVPVVTMSVPASSNFAIDFGLRGRAFAVGIVVCNSSTG